MLHMNDASVFIPETYLEVERACELLHIEKRYVSVYKRIYGIEKIPIARDISMVEFVKRPIEKLLQKNAIKKKNIKYLIHCHTAKVIAPFGDSIVRQAKHELGLQDAVAFGVSVNNCASTLASLDMLSYLLEHEHQAIIVSADFAFTPVLQLIPNTSILGDAAAAILVSRQKSANKLLSIALHIEGKYAHGIWLSASETHEFETRYIKLLSAIILSAIEKAKLTLSQIKIILPHNVNLPSWKRVADDLKISHQKIYLKNVKKYSHCFGSDIFINYVSIVEENLLQAGDYYVMATVGLGATFAAAVFQY